MLELLSGLVFERQGQKREEETTAAPGSKQRSLQETAALANGRTEQREEPVFVKHLLYTCEVLANPGVQGELSRNLC